MPEELHECEPENARKMADWIARRGGVAIWRSMDLSDLASSWSSPALTEDGKPYPKPSRIITDPREIQVVTRKEVKRFRVGLWTGAQGFSVKVTDGGSRRIRAEVQKAGDGASYHFDYETQEAVITVPGEVVLLSDFIGKHS